MSTSTASFGEKLRQLRGAASLSQEELAERSGLSVRGISDLERGARHAPRLETVRLLADALALADGARSGLLAAARPDPVRDDVAVSAASPPVSLPVPLTRLIGREMEVATLQARLSNLEERLLTVTGTGGTGKTRLALDVAATARNSFAGGIFFVDLSSLNDAALVIPTIAAALGVREVTGQDLRETLAGFLVGRRRLLVLDSCEQVLAAAPDIAALLTASPRLTILATSREPLRIRGEREFPLLPLPLPAADHLPGVGELAEVPAIALFIERAEASRPDFTLMPENAAAVAAICQRLDGLPLAIELAAARIKALSPTALLARLEHRLPLLTGGRDLPARQRTMRDAIAWSNDLLTPEAQGLFRQLAVFAGGFTLTAAESVAGPTSPDGESSVVNGVVALVEQSLLRPVSNTGGESRYVMLETVREFGLDRLAAASETEPARQRHAEHFLQLSADFLYGSPILMNLESLARVTDDQDNVRLALGWFDERGESEAVLRLSAMLYALWFARGLYSEGLQWAERALERSNQAASPARVQALDGSAMLAILQGDYPRAATFLKESLPLAQTLNDPFLVGEAMAYSGYLAYRLGDYARADHLLEEGLIRLRERPESAHGAFAFLILGDTALAQEQFERATNAYQEAIDRFQDAGYAWGLSDAQAGLAGVSFCSGNVERAATQYRESLERAWDLGFPMYVASSLLGLAAVAAASGFAEAGAHLLGAGEGLIASLAAPQFPRDQPIVPRGLSVLHATLGQDRLRHYA